MTPRPSACPLRTQARAWWLAIVLAMLAAPSWAQNGEPAATPAESTGEARLVEVTAIPVAQIGVAAERTQRRVAELADRLEAMDSIRAVESALPGQAAAVEALLARSLATRDGGDANLVLIDQLRGEWRLLEGDLEEAQKTLGVRAAEVSRLRAEISRDVEVWAATRAAASEAIEGSEVTQLIDGTVNDLVKVRETARKRQGDIVALQGRVARLTEAAAADVQALLDLRRGLVGRIFDRDRPPIWSSQFYDGLAPEDLLGRLALHRDREVIAFGRFAKHHRERLMVQLVVTLLLVPLMFSARTRVRRIEDRDDAVAHMQVVFEQPIALALLLSFFVFYWSYDSFPPLVSPLVGAAFLLPAVLILRRLLEPAFRPLLYLLLALFFVDRLVYAIAPLPALPRLIFVGEMFAVFGYSRWWQRASAAPDVPAQLRSSTSFKWVGHATRLAMLAAPIAIVAELTGYSALAAIVGGSILTGGYAAIALYGSARAIDGLVAWALIVRPLRLSGMVQRERVVIERHLHVYTRWLVTVLFVYVLLNRLELAEPTWRALRAFWAFEIPFISVGLSLGSIVEFLIVLRLTFAVSSFVQFVLDEEVYTRVRMAKGQPYAISTLTHYTVLTVGFVLAVLALGIDVNRFTVLAGALGVGIGFGLQTIVNNFVSGIILLTEQPIQVGDTVEIEGVSGEVRRIGIRSSTVRTWQGAEVIVPNSQLVAERVTNWTLSDDNRRLEIPVGVAYGTEPELVQFLLLRVATESPGVIGDPPPVAFFMGFGDSSLDFELRCWTDQADTFLRVRSELVVAIERALREAGITIPFPQRDLHVRTLGPERAAEPEAGAIAPSSGKRSEPPAAGPEASRDDEQA